MPPLDQPASLMTPEAWTSLATRVEGASGPDREIDRAIWAIPEVRVGGACYTASVDAVLALISETLPRWGWDAVQPAHGATGKPRACLYQGGSVYCGSAATPALAVLAAFCRAKAAEAGASS